LEVLIAPFRRSLLPACWDLLGKSVAAALVTRIERLVQARERKEKERKEKKRKRSVPEIGSL
jgi:hypothetical protein